MFDDEPKKAPKKKTKPKAVSPEKSVEAKAPKPTPEKKPKHFELKKWNKLDMYQCLHCPWSTLNQEEMVKHVAEHLAPEEPTIRRTDTGFVNATGDKIFREEVVGLSEEHKEE